MSLFKRLRANQAPARRLGVYLLCVGTYELVLTVWTQLRGGDSLIYFRFGFFALLDPLDSKLYAYYAMAFWILALAVILVLGFEPLKTYLVGEVILDLPSIYFTIGMWNEMHSWRFVAPPATLIFESVVPGVWAIVLLWRGWKLERLHQPLPRISGLRSLGFYLLAIAVTQAVWLVAYRFDYTDRFPRIAAVGTPVPTGPSRVCGLFIGPERLTREELDTDTPDQIEKAEKERASFANRDFCSLVPFLVNLGLAIAILQGLQPLKTLLVLYVWDLCFDALLLAARLDDRESVILGGLHWCLSLIPFSWATFLLVRRWRLRRRSLLDAPSPARSDCE